MNRPTMRATQRLALPLLFGWTVASSIAAPAHAAGPVCLYQSRTYSEGAFICVQKSLMQACTPDGSRLVWRIVADKEIGERCVSPIPAIEPRRRMVRRAQIARQAAAPMQVNSAKCFVFNGKRYCE